MTTREDVKYLAYEVPGTGELRWFNEDTFRPHIDVMGNSKMIRVSQADIAITFTKHDDEEDYES